MKVNRKITTSRGPEIGIDMDGGTTTSEGTPAERIVKAIKMLEERGVSGRLVLHGDEGGIREAFGRRNIPYEIVHAKSTHVIGENRRVRGSSLNNMVADFSGGFTDGLLSYGDTAHLMVEAKKLGRFPGVRPMLLAKIPSKTGFHFLADAGASVSSSPDVSSEEVAMQVYRQGVMAAAYTKHAFRIKRPSIGILCNGTEDSKGNAMVMALDELIKCYEGITNPLFNYVGRVEPLRGDCNIVLADAFTANIDLKAAGGTFKYLKEGVSEAFAKLSWFDKLRLLPARGVLKKIKEDMLSYASVKDMGSAALVGYRGSIFKGHGNSTTDQIFHGIMECSKRSRKGLADMVFKDVKKYVKHTV